MSPDAAFFWTVLILQAVFTAALVLLVGRRFPRRLPAYRWIAPAAVPLFFLGLAALVCGSAPHPPVADLARIALAYTVLWLAGVVWAGMLVRWFRR